MRAEGKGVWGEDEGPRGLRHCLRSWPSFDPGQVREAVTEAQSQMMASKYPYMQYELRTLGTKYGQTDTFSPFPFCCTK